MNTCYRKLITICVGIFGMLILMAAMPVSAGNEFDQLLRTYPATRCQIWGPDKTSGLDNSAGYSQFGKLANKHHSKSLHIVCPIDRKENFSQDGLNFVRVYFLDRHLTKGLTCSVYSMNVNGETVVDVETITNNEGGSNEFKQMTFYNIDKSRVFDDNFQVGPGGMYTLFCTIPPKIGRNGFSWVSGYTVREISE